MDAVASRRAGHGRAELAARDADHHRFAACLGTTLLRFMLRLAPRARHPARDRLPDVYRSSWSGERGRLLRERFADAVTAYPPESPGWADFGIPAELFRRELAGLRPFSVAEGFRLFYRT